MRDEAEDFLETAHPDALRQIAGEGIDKGILFFRI